MLKAGMKDESDSDEVRMIVIVMKYVSRVILHLIIAVKNLLLIKRFKGHNISPLQWRSHQSGEPWRPPYLPADEHSNCHHSLPNMIG